MKWSVDTYHPCGDTKRKLKQSVTPRITWTPHPHQVGQARIILEADDGTRRSTLTYDLVVRHDENAVFLPGGSYSIYAPKGHSSVYHGPAFELLLGGWIRQNENYGPSNGRVYTSIGMLTGKDLPDAVAFNFGFDLSFERNPRRSFLIPYFGLETGGLFRENAKNIWHFTPTLGVYLWSSENLFFNISGGHLFPTARVDELPGYTGRASLNLAFW